MAVKSMTGFARADGVSPSFSWHWEVRSVNGRGLDIRMRLPSGFEGLEPRAREAVGRFVTRGSVNITLNAKRTQGLTEIQLNEKALDQVLAVVELLKSKVAMGPPSAEALLNIKGLIEVVEVEETEAEALVRTEAMLASLETALAGMVQSRSREGARLGTILAEQFNTIELLVDRIEQMPARSPESIRSKLKQQIDRLLETGSGVDEGRLYQEAALIAVRADIEEELKRLRTHLAAARELLEGSEPAGRRLDFLAQEFNREANTVCSKSNDADVTRAGIDLKAVIDQMREQVQNIE
jgi:uncharacterized protein (TIGR00255 family)